MLTYARLAAHIAQMDEEQANMPVTVFVDEEFWVYTAMDLTVGENFDDMEDMEDMEETFEDNRPVIVVG